MHTCNNIHVELDYCNRVNVRFSIKLMTLIPFLGFSYIFFDFIYILSTYLYLYQCFYTYYIDYEDIAEAMRFLSIYVWILN